MTGKGGVGKSTCAAALALAAVRRRKRVLLAELSARSVALDLLGVHGVTHVATEAAPETLPGLFVAHLDAHQALTEYLSELLGVPRLVHLATENRILARLWQAAPSVAEMAVLNALYQHERAQGRGGGPRFDLIVVDMPATGHALQTLTVPKGALGMIRVGSLAERAHEIDLLLHDRRRTAVCIVTLPEELPINEAVQLATKLHANLQIETSHVVINRILPSLFDPAERALLDRLSTSGRVGEGQALIDAVQPNQDRHQGQLARIESLKQRIAAQFIEVKELARRGVGLVEAVAVTLGEAG